MGTWGTGILDNDAALNWLESFKKRKSLRRIESKIRGCLKAKPGKFEEVYEEALVAIEVLTFIQGRKVPERYLALESWIRSQRIEDSREIISFSRDCINRVTNSKEIKELWHDSKDWNSWKKGVKQLDQFLNETSQSSPKPKNTSKKSTPIKRENSRLLVICLDGQEYSSTTGLEKALKLLTEGKVKSLRLVDKEYRKQAKGIRVEEFDYNRLVTKGIALERVELFLRDWDLQRSLLAEIPASYSCSELWISFDSKQGERLHIVMHRMPHLKALRIQFVCKNVIIAGLEALKQLRVLALKGPSEGITKLALPTTIEQLYLQPKLLSDEHRLPNLKGLVLAGAGESDMYKIKAPDLRELRVLIDSKSDTIPLLHFPRLERLRLERECGGSYKTLTSLDQLESLTMLKALYLNNFTVKNLPSLASLSSLIWWDCGKKGILDIAKQKHLAELSLGFQGRCPSKQLERVLSELSLKRLQIKKLGAEAAIPDKEVERLQSLVKRKIRSPLVIWPDGLIGHSLFSSVYTSNIDYGSDDNHL